jgi:predicted phage tail protein
MELKIKGTERPYREGMVGCRKKAFIFQLVHNAALIATHFFATELAFGTLYC